MKNPFYVSTFCCIDSPLETALETLATRTSRVEVLSDGLHDIRVIAGRAWSTRSLILSMHRRVK